MTFDVDNNSGSNALFGRSRKLLIMLNLVFALAVSAWSGNAMAAKIKLAVFPVNDTMDLKKQQREYLYDVIREAASASAGSYIALIHEQKIKGLLKKRKGACDEDCALKSAGSADARVALVVEMHQHDSQILGVVKLLDVKEQVLLTVKRFFSNTLQGAEQELQGAVMFVLSAQFLPISESDRAALSAEQQNIQLAYAQPGPQQNQPQQTSPSTPVQPTPVTESAPPQQQPEYSYSNKDIAQPDEPTSPRAYLVTAIVTGAVGLGFGVATALTGAQLGREVKKKNDQMDAQKDLKQTYDRVYEGEMEEAQFNLKFEDMDLTYAPDGPDRTKIEDVLAAYSANIDLVNEKIVLNGILTGVFGGLTVASLIVSATFTVKYMKAQKNSPTALREPRFYITPVVARDMNGAVFGATF